MTTAVLRVVPWVAIVGAVLVAVVGGAGNLRASSQQVDLNRAAIVQRYFTALDNGDVDGALAMFADNATFVGTRPTGNCSAQTPCTDLAGIRMQFEGNLSQGHHCQFATSIEVIGSTVVGRAVARNDAVRGRGLERILQTFIAQVPQDKITAIYLLYDLTDAQTAANLAIQAGTQVAGTPIPTPDPPCPEAGS